MWKMEHSMTVNTAVREQHLQKMKVTEGSMGELPEGRRGGGEGGEEEEEGEKKYI
jgi:hypothetical protein